MKKLILPEEKTPKLHTGEPVENGWIKEIFIKKYSEWSDPEKSFEFLWRWYMAIWFLSIKYGMGLKAFDHVPLMIHEMYEVHLSNPIIFMIGSISMNGGELNQPQMIITPEAVSDLLKHEFEVSFQNFYEEKFVACLPKSTKDI